MVRGDPFIDTAHFHVVIVGSADPPWGKVAIGLHTDFYIVAVSLLLEASGLYVTQLLADRLRFLPGRPQIRAFYLFRGDMD